MLDECLPNVTNVIPHSKVSRLFSNHPNILFLRFTVQFSATTSAF